jgi:ribosomal protein L37AE/L43A
MHPFDDGKGGIAHAPIIRLEGGAYLSFVTQETDVGEYGTEITYTKPPARRVGTKPLRGKNSVVCPHCQTHTEQVAVDANTRLCTSCGETFKKATAPGLEKLNEYQTAVLMEPITVSELARMIQRVQSDVKDGRPIDDAMAAEAARQFSKKQ